VSSSDFHGIITGLALPSAEETHNDMLSPFLAQRTPIKKKLIQECEEKTYKSSSNTQTHESSEIEIEPIIERAKMD
jgi:TFIIF-interacting CTD phosphatase-like protein